MSQKVRHVLITGASRGLGRALAHAFHRRGDKVSLLARNGAELTTLQHELGSGSAAYAGDIREASTRTHALKEFEDQFGPVDVLVNNAGIGSYRSFLECDPADLAAQVEVNLTSLILLTHAVAQKMVARRSGVIVNVASDLARKPLAKMAVYTGTKHGLAGFSTSLSRELKEHGVKVILANPGIINTHFGGQTPKATEESWQLKPEEVADAIVFVASQPANVLIDELTIHPLGQDF